MRTERSDVKSPMWRKKVDRSLFHHNGTTIPQWVCRTWGIQEDFSASRSIYDASAKVKIVFNSKEYEGWVTIAPKGRTTPAYRLWYSDELRYKLEDAFVMSFVRDIEGRLRESKKSEYLDVEEEIPFWEFLDIEYERQTKTFYFKAYYTVKPAFSELFKHFIESPILHKIDDELSKKPPFRIYKTDWKPRDKLEFELGATNVLYMLIDSKKKLLYIGEAANLIDRLRDPHPSISNWDYFRYDVLPNEIADHRDAFERMLICDFAALLKGLPTKERLSYNLVNAKVDNLSTS